MRIGKRIERLERFRDWCSVFRLRELGFSRETHWLPRYTNTETALAAALGRDRGPGRPADQLFLDDDERILFDGKEEMREWVGRHVSEWPEEWWEDPWPMRLYAGVDPLVVLGLAPEPPAKGRDLAVGRITEGG